MHKISTFNVDLYSLDVLKWHQPYLWWYHHSDEEQYGFLPLFPGACVCVEWNPAAVETGFVRHDGCGDITTPPNTPYPPHHHHHPFPVHLSCVRPAPEQSFNLYAAFCASAFQSIGTLYWKTVASKCIRFKRANLSRLCCLAFSQFITIRRSVCPQSRQTQRCWPTLRRSPPSLPHTHLNSNLHLSQGIPSQHTHLLPFYLFHLFIYLFIYICSY